MIYSLSKHKLVNPADKLLEILLTELKAPYNVFLTKLPAPKANPIPPSRGPLANPSIGFSIKSLKPVVIFPNNPIGLPIMLRLPKHFKTSTTAYDL